MTWAESLPPAWSSARDLDRALGDPHMPGSLVSYARTAELDMLEQFPESEARLLDRLGIPRHYVPRRWGGEFSGLDRAVEMLRPVARRDLTLAIGHAKTFLGCAPVWVAGDDRQCRQLADEVLDGAVVSWGLTERDNGSDLASSTFRATPHNDGYTLDGEKWLINNARRCHFVTVLARTSEAPGSRSHSLFLVDRRPLGPREYAALPRERLHGIRGADISGLRMTGVEVAPNSRIGELGQGLEVCLLALQLTRVLCTGLSLGAADHALEIGLDQVQATRRYGAPIIDLPQTRRLLAEAVADVHLADALTRAAARSAQLPRGELAVLSPTAKYLVPTVVDEVIASVGSLVGTRSLLIGDRFVDGRFQKLTRDHRLVGIFDGSSHVNLAALIAFFPFLARARGEGTSAEQLRALLDLEHEPDSFDPSGLSIVPRDGSLVLTSLPSAAAEIRELSTRGVVPPEIPAGVDALLLAAGDVNDRIRQVRPGDPPPARDFELARDLTLVLAGAAAVHTWLAGQGWRRMDDVETPWADGAWMRGAVARVLQRLGQSPRDTGWREPLVYAALAGAASPLGAAQSAERQVVPV